MDTLHFPFKSQRITRLSELDEYFDEYRKDKADEAILESFYNAFAANDFDVDAFMIAGSYNLVSDRGLRYELLRGVLNVAPIRESFPVFGNGLYIIDWDCFFNPDGSNSWGETYERHLDEDTVFYLYLCDSECDVWRLFALGMGDVSKLYNYYYLRDDHKAKEFLKYIYKEAGRVNLSQGFGNNEIAIAFQIAKKFSGDSTRIRAEVENILHGIDDSLDPEVYFSNNSTDELC